MYYIPNRAKLYLKNVSKTMIFITWQNRAHFVCSLRFYLLVHVLNFYIEKKNYLNTDPHYISGDLWGPLILCVFMAM